MERRFECKDCHGRFTAEETSEVKCPHCGSDNIDYVRFHFPYKYLIILLCATIAIFLLSKIEYSFLFSHSGEDSGSHVTDSTECILQDTIDYSEIETDMGIEIPPSISGVSDMKVDKDGSYHFVVKVSHAPENGFRVVITDIKTNEVVATSKDGVFVGVPFSKNGGQYNAYVAKTSTDEALSEPTLITGFVEIEPISKKLSVKDLQDLINSQDPSLLGHDNKYLSPVYKLKYSNPPNGSDYLPDNLADVFEMLDMGAWTSAEVASVEYDETNHISTITLKVAVPSRPDFDN